MDNLKWLQERTRSGSLDANTGGWQKVCEFLPYLQNIRLDEKRMATANRVIPSKRSDKGVEAIAFTVSNGVQAVPDTVEYSVQVTPMLVEQEVEAIAETTEVSIDATPILVDVDITAAPVVVEESIAAHPSTMSRAVGTFVSTASKYVETIIEPLILLEDTRNTPPPPQPSHFPALPFVPSVRDVVSFPFRVVCAYGYYVTLPLRFLLFSSSLDPNNENPQKQDESQMQEKVGLQTSTDNASYSNSEANGGSRDGGAKSTSPVGHL
jgi:hypothetical protein